LHQIAQSTVDVRAKHGAEKVENFSERGNGFSLCQELIEDDSAFARFEGAQGGLKAGAPIGDDREDQVQDGGVTEKTFKNGWGPAFVPVPGQHDND